MMRTRLKRPTRPPRPDATLRRRIGLLRFAVASLAALQLASPAGAADETRRHQGNGAATAMSSKPDAVLGEPAIPSHRVNEGGAQRPLWMDSSRVADFGGSPGSDHPSIRAALPADLAPGTRNGKPAEDTAPEKDQSTAGGQPPSAARLSPIFFDASGRPRALPGGVIVSLKQGLPPEQAREQLQAAGLEPIRQIGEKMWLVGSPAGLASLELAQRLDADGRFGFAQPNWWHPRTTK